MLTWIIQNLATIIISLVLLLIVALIIIKMVRDKKRGKTCSGCENASGCPYSSKKG
jgi:hypothetical protein